MTESLFTQAFLTYGEDDRHVVDTASNAGTPAMLILSRACTHNGRHR